MKKVSKKISLALVLVLCILSMNPLVTCAFSQQLFGNELSLPETFVESEEEDEFVQGEMNDVLVGEEWFVGENEESCEGGFLAGDEQPDGNPEYGLYNLDDPDESSDLNISINGITGLMENRRALADYLDVIWDQDQNKFMIQGGCSDGEYVYYAFNSYKISPRETVCQKILCAKLSEDGSIDLDTAKVNTFTYLDHANSLTYNSKTDQVVVANCYADVVVDGESKKTDEHFRLTILNAAYLRGEEGETSEATYRYIPCRVSAIAYDEYEDQYIVGITGKKYSFAILNSDFILEKVIGYQPGYGEPVYSNWTRNDIWCDHSNIYSMVLYSTSGFKNILMVFDKEAIENAGDNDSITAKEVNLNSSEYYEGENIFRHGDKFLIGYSYVESGKNNNYGYVDIAETDMFKVEYEPNYDRTNNVTSEDSTRKNSLVIYCAPTRLMKNTFSNTGYKFKGWAAYWVEGNKWYCETNGTRAWKTSYSSNSDLYLYADNQKVSKTVPKGHTVVMVAQWEETDKFYVTFLSNDEYNLSSTQQCTHGSANTLNACSFIDTHKSLYNKNETANDINNSFLGWHAHWVEGDKWYYVSADGSTRGWYAEGDEPDGYKKYVYSDGAGVRQTVPKGHNVEMHAFWNEFKTYYFAGAKEIAFDKILLPTVCIIRENANSRTTSLETYIDNDKTPWYAYNVEDSKWYYRNEGNTVRGWYTFDSQPEGYVKYINRVGTVRNTADAGESLVMCWTAGTSSTFDFQN